MGTKFAWHARVISVEQRFSSRHISGIGVDAVMVQVSLGWFVRISESSAVRVGNERPDLKPGDNVKITLERDDG